MTGDCHVRFSESARVRFPRATQLTTSIPNRKPLTQGGSVDFTMIMVFENPYRGSQSNSSCTPQPVNLDEDAGFEPVIIDVIPSIIYDMDKRNWDFLFCERVEPTDTWLK